MLYRAYTTDITLLEHLSMRKRLKIDSELVHLGRDLDKSSGYVNIPPYEGSTILHHDIADMKNRVRLQMNGEPSFTYGTEGGPAHQAFYEAMNQLEGGAGTWAYGTGLAGCVTPFFAFVQAGDHVLVTDSVYGPTRDFCETLLKRLGVEVEFYDPLIGSGIERLIRQNTRLIYMESPGSHTLEMQDVPAIIAAAKKKDVITMIDNTYATPLNFNPLRLGADVVIHAATKYICGHSDVLMSTVTCSERTWPEVKRVSKILGQYASAQSCYLGLRGLRTLKVRMDAIGAHTQAVVDWLSQRKEVESILWPAYPKDPGYAIYKRDFSGPIGLFCFAFKPNFTDEQIDKFLDSLTLFGLGYSWGGFESLILRCYGKRTVRNRTDLDRMVRVYIGLEDPSDLIADLEHAFSAIQ